MYTVDGDQTISTRGSIIILALALILLFPLLPIKPTSLIVSHIRVPSLLSLLSRRGRSFPTPTIENHFLGRVGFTKHVVPDEFGFVKGRSQVVFEDAEWEGDGAWDGSESLFVGFTDVCGGGWMVST